LTQQIVFNYNFITCNRFDPLLLLVFAYDRYWINSSRY